MSTTIEASTIEVPSNEINQPWSAKATIGFTFLLFVIYVVISMISLAVGASIETASLGTIPENTQAIGVAQQLALDGDFNAINYLVTALCLSPVIFYIAGRRKVTTAASYLGFDKLPSKATFINFNFLLLGYFVFSYFASNALGIEIPQSIIEIYTSTDYMFLLLFVVIIAAPIFEELVFRGFIFKGLKNSPLGISGTIVVTSVLFTLIHAGQYNFTILAVLFPLAVILGLARLRSGSIYLPIYLHFVNNLYSSIEMYFFMN